MSEMIDRVAKALAWVHHRTEDNWQEWREDACAAIEAMRTPTEAMIDAACCCERGDTVGDALRDEYQAMIDAALSTPDNDKT